MKQTTKEGPVGTVTRTALFAKPEVKETLVELRRVVRNALPDAGFAEREEAMLAIFDEAGRGVLEEDLQAIADDFGDRLLVAGVEYKRHHGGVSKYHCLSGILCIRRHTYRRTGTRNGRTVVPLELVTGLAEGATPALAYNVMHGYGQRDMRQHAEALLAAHRLAPPRATLERMAKRLAQPFQGVRFEVFFAFASSRAVDTCVSLANRVRLGTGFFTPRGCRL